MSAGKGSRPRPVNQRIYDANHAEIRWASKRKPYISDEQDAILNSGSANRERNCMNCKHGHDCCTTRRILSCDGVSRWEAK